MQPGWFWGQFSLIVLRTVLFDIKPYFHILRYIAHSYSLIRRHFEVLHFIELDPVIVILIFLIDNLRELYFLLEVRCLRCISRHVFHTVVPFAWLSMFVAMRANMLLFTSFKWRGVQHPGGVLPGKIIEVNRSLKDLFLVDSVPWRIVILWSVLGPQRVSYLRVDCQLLLPTDFSRQELKLRNSPSSLLIAVIVWVKPINVLIHHVEHAWSSWFPHIVNIRIKVYFCERYPVRNRLPQVYLRVRVKLQFCIFILLDFGWILLNWLLEGVDLSCIFHSLQVLIQSLFAPFDRRSFSSNPRGRLLRVSLARNILLKVNSCCTWCDQIGV